MTGRFRPGDQLDLDDICAEYGCSRTPVREAIQYLSNSGLVKVRPKRGTFVSRLTVREPTERFEVMAELEGLCAALSAHHMAPEVAERMHTRLRECESFFEAGTSTATTTRTASSIAPSTRARATPSWSGRPSPSRAGSRSTGGCSCAWATD